MGAPRTIRSLLHDTLHQVRVRPVDGGYHVTCDAPDVDATVLESGSKMLAVTTHEGSFEATVELDDDEICVTVGQERFVFAWNVRDEPTRGPLGAVSGRADIRAPMPGKVVQILVAVGDSVRAGQGLLLFEAMKMQNEIRAPTDGRVVDLSVDEGQTVEAKQQLLVVDGSQFNN